jgi:hypothetical protein
MAGRAAWGACGLAVSVALTELGIAAAAAVPPPQDVVVHLDDRVGVPPADLAKAKAEVERVFQAAGVEITWVEERLRGPFRPVRGAVAIMIVNSTPNPKRQAPGCVLGLAVQKLASAYAYHDRIAGFARTRPVDSSILLGRVIAHELGHLLLPPGSHSTYGIMRADVDWGVENPARFTREQAATLRARLVTQMAQR